MHTDTAGSDGLVAVTTTSADLTAALTPGPSISLAPDSAVTTADGVVVDDEQTFQTVLGFGATFTDSSAWLVRHALHPDARGPYFGYFTYDDEPPQGSDPELAHFSIGHDEPYVLPTLREALRITPGHPGHAQRLDGAGLDRGAVRIASSEPAGARVRTVAFRKPDGTLVLVAHNGDRDRRRPLRVTWCGRWFTASVPAGGSATYRWRSGHGPSREDV